MDNLKLPAYPMAYQFGKEYNHDCVNESGFTKLEKAALMIALGFIAHGCYDNQGESVIARDSVILAKAVLEEANK